MKPCFLLDGMLGSLARWLRILGYDTLYYVDKQDQILLDEAKETERVLVTRDKALFEAAERDKHHALLIESEDTLEQLRQIVKAQGLETKPRNTRCPRCNGELNQVEKQKVKDKVPEQSFKAYEKYWVCNTCNSVYWRGSHWDKIKKALKTLDGSKFL